MSGVIMSHTIVEGVGLLCTRMKILIHGGGYPGCTVERKACRGYVGWGELLRRPNRTPRMSASVCAFELNADVPVRKKVAETPVQITPVRLGCG